MKLRILSDLHLEFAPFDIKYAGEDILILAGDISTEIESVMLLVMDYLRQNNTVIVLFVLGNHDYYGNTISGTIQFYKDINIPRFHLLQDKSIVINGTRFFGATMWTDLQNTDDDLIEFSITDYWKIKNFDTQISKSLHHASKNILKTVLDLSSEPVVVITHHLPSFKSILPKYYGNPTNPAFASNLDELVPHSRLWIHGHSHSTVDYTLEGTRVVCNPRGYVKNNKQENHDFQECFIVDI